jgi:hypothetical protein
MYEISKKLLRNILKLSEKIQAVLKIKGLNISRAERLMNVSTGTLSKTVERDSGWHQSSEDKFLRTFNVNKTWWNTGKGNILHGPESQKDGDADLNQRALRTAYDLIDKLNDDIERLQEELSSYKKKSKT